jgi:hypothetical protein
MVCRTQNPGLPLKGQSHTLGLAQNLCPECNFYMNGGIFMQLGTNILHSVAENLKKIQVSMAKVKVTLRGQRSNKTLICKVTRGQIKISKFVSLHCILLMLWSIVLSGQRIIMVAKFQTLMFLFANIESSPNSSKRLLPFICTLKPKN